MRYLAFSFFLVFFGVAWTFVSIILALPIGSWVRKQVEAELAGYPPSKASLWFTKLYNFLTWVPQPIIVAAATLATLERHPDAWQWLYFITGLGASTPIGAHAPQERESLTLRDHLFLLSLNAIFVVCYFVPQLIPHVLWNLGSWLGR